MIGYRRGRWELSVEALNLLDAKADDVAYSYQSRLMGEPAAGVADLHVHPAEPFELRASLTARY
jgi:hypothetical protein